MREQRVIGFIGGTGAEGRGLAVRFARAGRDVVIGSRDAGRAEAAARDVAARLPARGVGSVRGARNRDAARLATLVFFTVPFDGLRSVIEDTGAEIAGKVCVNVLAPLEFSRGAARVVVPPAGSAAQAGAQLAPQARWVAAFHTLPARVLLNPERAMNTDALVCSNDADAKRTIMDLAETIAGIRAVDAGALENARYLEGATALLVNINRIYRAHASLTVTGI